MYGNLVRGWWSRSPGRRRLAGLELVSARPGGPGIGDLLGLEQAVAARDMQRVKTVAANLHREIHGTPTRLWGACRRPGILRKPGTQDARAQLSWAADNSKDELGRHRTPCACALLLDEQAYDEALKQLCRTRPPGFRRAALPNCGRSHRRPKGKKAEASQRPDGRSGSPEAKPKAQGGNPFSEVVQQKPDRDAA